MFNFSTARLFLGCNSLSEIIDNFLKFRCKHSYTFYVLGLKVYLNINFLKNKFHKNKHLTV